MTGRRPDAPVGVRGTLASGPSLRFDAVACGEFTSMLLATTTTLNGFANEYQQTLTAAGLCDEAPGVVNALYEAGIDLSKTAGFLQGKVTQMGAIGWAQIGGFPTTKRPSGKRPASKMSTATVNELVEKAAAAFVSGDFALVGTLKTRVDGAGRSGTQFLQSVYREAYTAIAFAVDGRLDQAAGLRWNELAVNRDTIEFLDDTDSRSLASLAAKVDFRNEYVAQIGLGYAATVARSFAHLSAHELDEIESVPGWYRWYRIVDAYPEPQRVPMRVRWNGFGESVLYLRAQAGDPEAVDAVKRANSTGISEAFHLLLMLNPEIAVGVDLAEALIGHDVVTWDKLSTTQRWLHAAPALLYGTLAASRAVKRFSVAASARIEPAALGTAKDTFIPAGTTQPAAADLRELPPPAEARGTRSGHPAAHAQGDLVLPELSIEPGQLQHAFKHADDFGVKGTWNKANGQTFEKALKNHFADKGTSRFPGTYRGQPVIHNLDQVTGLNVIQTPTGQLLSAWKLSGDQLKHVLESGKLGGGS